MSAQIETLKTRTAKPIVAGVFDIIIGSLCLLAVVILGIVGLVFTPALPDVPVNLGFIFWLAVVPLTAIGVISIIGGIYSLQRKMWGWALAGSITTFLASNVLGIFSIILTAISRNEFANN
jgi:hypothetical protein